MWSVVGVINIQLSTSQKQNNEEYADIYIFFNLNIQEKIENLLLIIVKRVLKFFFRRKIIVNLVGCGKTDSSNLNKNIRKVKRDLEHLAKEHSSKEDWSISVKRFMV